MPKEQIVILLLILSFVAPGSSKAAKRVPVTASYQEGVALYEAGQYHRALRLWERMLKDRSDELTRKQKMALRTRIAAASRMMKISPEANTPQARSKAAYEDGKAAFDEGVQILLAEKKNYDTRSKKHFKEALNHFTRAQTLGHQEPRLPHLIAFACLYTEELKRGWPYLDQSIKQNPRDPRPLNLKADYLKKSGAKIWNRIKTLKRSLELDPKQQIVHLKLCKAYLATRQRKFLKSAYYHGVKGIGKSVELAKKLASLFPVPSYRNKLDAIAAKLAVEKERKKLPSKPSWEQGEFGAGRVSSTLIRVH